MELETLKLALVHCWGKDTSYPPMEHSWSSKNPAYGQCFATALLVHDYYGGQLLKAKFADGTAHFWNTVNSKEIDLTKSQFNKQQIPQPTLHSRQEIDENPRYKEYHKRY
ncbi:hypothetical protein GF342_03690 [Candidatus Woesearchaeota archaeon]|nr:hypothetical protein [Candidatus Woesearchaeota archaeon]